MDSSFWHRSLGPALRTGPRPDVSRILSNLLIGEYATPEDAEWLRLDHGVTAVLCLQDDADLAGKRLDLAALRRAYDSHDVTFHHLPIADGDNQALAARVDEIVALLHELLSGGECVYLHCNAGLNRAPTIAIAYLHAHQGLSLAAARDFVKARRPCVPYMAVLQARYSGES